MVVTAHLKHFNTSWAEAKTVLLEGTESENSALFYVHRSERLKKVRRRFVRGVLYTEGRRTLSFKCFMVLFFMTSRKQASLFAEVLVANELAG